MLVVLSIVLFSKMNVVTRSKTEPKDAPFEVEAAVPAAEAAAEQAALKAAAAVTVQFRADGEAELLGMQCAMDDKPAATEKKAEAEADKGESSASASASANTVADKGEADEGESSASASAKTGKGKADEGESSASASTKTGKGKADEGESSASASAKAGKGKAPITRSKAAAMDVPVSTLFTSTLFTLVEGFTDEPCVWDTVEEDFYFVCMMGDVGGLDNWMQETVTNPFTHPLLRHL